MDPAELACRWFGHRIEQLLVKTPKKLNRRGDLLFFITEGCVRCDVTREELLAGDEAYCIGKPLLLEGSLALRVLKNLERERR